MPLVIPEKGCAAKDWPHVGLLRPCTSEKAMLRKVIPE